MNTNTHTNNTNINTAPAADDAAHDAAAAGEEKDAGNIRTHGVLHIAKTFDEMGLRESLLRIEKFNQELKDQGTYSPSRFTDSEVSILMPVAAQPRPRA